MKCSTTRPVKTVRVTLTFKLVHVWSTFLWDTHDLFNAQLYSLSSKHVNTSELKCDKYTALFRGLYQLINTKRRRTWAPLKGIKHIIKLCKKIRCLFLIRSLKFNRRSIKRKHRGCKVGVTWGPFFLKF